MIWGPRKLLQLSTVSGWKELAASLRPHRYSLAISLAVTLLGLIAFISINWVKSLGSLFVFVDNVEARSLDARFQFRGPLQPGPEIAIVAIDQKTIDRLGWPFARSNYAHMLRTLNQDGAKVVGFDIDFPFPDRSAASASAFAQLEEEYRASRGTSETFLNRLQTLREESDSDAQFAQAIQEADNVVLGHLFFTDRADIEHMDPEQIRAYDQVLVFQAYPQVLKRTAEERYRFYLDAPDAIAVEPNLPIFASAARTYGAFNFEADNDGTYRRAPVIFHYNDPNRPSIEENFYPSLDIQVARLYLGVQPQDTIVWFNPNGLDVIELGPKKIYPDVSGKVLINFAGPTQTYPYYSFADVADGLTPKGTFRDKIVLVGASAIGIGDIRPTPFSKQGYPGIEIHANVLDNLLHDNFLRRGFSEEMADLWILLFCGFLMGILFVLLRPLVSSFLYAIALLGLLGFVFYQFSAHGRWLSLVLPAATLSLNYLGVTSYRVLFEEKEKRKVRGAFSQYVAPGFINQILKDPARLKLGGEQVDLTVMFSDIRGFTSISEKLTPPELVELLNEYLTAMTEVVFQNRGTLDKYIGDAVMAFWGRPFLDLHDHAACACRAALEMSSQLKTLNEAWRSQGRPPMNIGIGINTGPMMVGNMGSQRRFNYTVMGDHVNLSSRVEGLNKEYGTQIILTEFTYEYVRDQFVTRELDLIRVKGKKKPVAIHELLAPASEQNRYRELLGDFQQGLAAYKAGNWDEAYEIFQALASRYPSDGPVKVLLARCQRFLREAPVGAWDGVYTMTTK
ncbi:MAG: CHASE2 domain-containing protein [Acidobacteria bacterium]|nr:CHASE2 domain-containing protein [Acidobacteriota bacterium]